MSLTLLFDLDGTLLDTNMESFVPAYFQALSGHMASRVSPDLMLPALLSATKAMMENEDPGQTLQEVFDAEFYPKLRISKHDLLNVIDVFYKNIFPQIQNTTRLRPEAAPLIDWAFECGYRVAIATDPIFPREATHHRLRWAGLEPSRFELVSTFEDFHFSKSHTAYYAEVLGQLGWPEGPILMVGNDVARDLVPANRLGLKTYFIDGDPASSPGFEAGCGTLADLRPWLESTDISALEPSFKSAEAVTAILRSTPAAISSLMSSVASDEWKLELARDDWALNEIICHLRDTELEVHAQQIDLILERDDAFIPRPETSVWASERDYLHIDGGRALNEFIQARIMNLERLKNIDSTFWERKARHAIFGPTNFLEVTRFMAEHDRMHIQQAWNVLGTLKGLRV